MANHSTEREAILSFLKDARQKNAVTWAEGDSKTFLEKGYYSWMCSFVKDYHTILEVGVGCGYATLELVKSGHKVIGIEENTECLKIALNNLQNASIKCECVYRGHITPIYSTHKYKIDYDKITIDCNSDVILLEGDIIDDPYLHLWLKGLPKFDAVISWLIGTHGGKAFNMNCDGILQPSDYRLICENRTYELADIILREQGTLNIIDRTQKMDDEMQDIFIKSHIDQAELTSLVVIPRVYQKEYDQPVFGVPMGGVSAKAMENGLVFASILSKKNSK